MMLRLRPGYLMQDSLCGHKTTRDLGKKWLPGVVIERTGPVSYKVEVLGIVWRQHVDQLLLREELAGVLMLLFQMICHHLYP